MCVCVCAGLGHTVVLLCLLFWMRGCWYYNRTHNISNFFFFAFCYAVSLLHNTFICNSSCTSYSRCERLRVCKRTYNSATNIRHTEFRAKTQNKVAETECFLQLSGTRLVSVPTGKPMHNRGLSLLYSVTEIPVYCHGRTWYKFYVNPLKIIMNLDYI